MSFTIEMRLFLAQTVLVRGGEAGPMLKPLTCWLAFSVAMAAVEARANDSSAELSTGGLVLTKNDAIELRAEDLFICVASSKRGLAASEALIIESLRKKKGHFTGPQRVLADELQIPLSTLNAALRRLKGRNLIRQEKRTLVVVDARSREGA